jgi:hypothetical protein
VIDTGADQSPEKAAKVEVDKNRQTVQLFDKSNALIGFYPATVGSEEKPSPSGILKESNGDRPQSDLSLQSRLPLQGRPFTEAFHHQAGTEQSCRHDVDQSFRRRLWNPWHPVSRTGVQIGIAWLRPSDELGRRTRRRTGIQGDARDVRRRHQARSSLGTQSRALRAGIADRVQHFQHLGPRRLGRDARRRIVAGGRLARAHGEAERSRIQPCSSHSRIAPASSSVEIAQPRNIRIAGRLSVVISIKSLQPGRIPESVTRSRRLARGRDSRSS